MVIHRKPIQERIAWRFDLADLAAGRVPDDDFPLLASVPYDEIGVDRARAELKSRFLSQFAAEVIRAEFPELASKMAMRTAVLDWKSRQLETLGGVS